MSPSNCPSRNLLAAFREGRVSETQIEEITGHLTSGCPTCHTLLDELDNQGDYLRDLLRQHPFPRLPGNQVNNLPRIGEVLSGYEILDVLGSGGMGVVYKARHRSIKPVVALKMILSGPNPGALAIERFAVEGQAVTQLRHANIVQVYEVGEHKGAPFLALELIEGGNLASKLQGTPLPSREAARTVEALAYGVQHAHERGIIHRDLKPANVLLTRDGTPKITDFGLAKQVEGSQGLTQPDAIMGTPSYMAPEQANGNVKEIGPRTDVYALGAILYECLTGRPPFKAATPLDTLLQVRTDNPVPVRRLQPAVPRDLETICHHCLHHRAAKRYGSARELAEDLRRFQQGQAVKARPESAVARMWRWTRRHPLAAVFALTILASLTVCGWFWYQTVQSKDAVEVARREAEENFQRTRQLLPDLVTAESGPWQQVAERRRAKRASLERADALYRQFCAAHPADHELRGERANVLAALTEIELSEARYEPARDTAQEALDLLATLPQDAMAKPRWRRLRADTLSKLAEAWKNLRQIDNMLTAYHEALESYRQLADASPDNAEYQLAACAVRIRGLGLSWQYLSRTDLLQPLMEENRRCLTAYLRNVGDSAAVRLLLVETLYNLGRCHEWRGNGAAALRCWREGTKWGTGLADALPNEADAWRFPALCARCLPSTEPGFLPPEQALIRLERAAQIQEASLVFDPDNIFAAIRMVEVTRDLADCYFTAGRLMEALRAQRRALEAMPSRPGWSLTLNSERLELMAAVAYREWQVGQKERALGHAREVADAFMKYCDSHAADSTLLLDAVISSSQFVPPLRHVGALDQSRRVAERALQLARQLEGSYPDAIHLRALADAWTQLAKCCVQDDPVKVEAALYESVVVARRLVALDKDSRFVLDDKLCRLARHLGDLGRRREAVACLRECEALWRDNANGLRGVAFYFRKLANQVSDDKTELSPAEREERDAYLAEAARLQKAADALQP